MRAGADLSPAGLGRLVSALPDRFDLHDVTGALVERPDSYTLIPLDQRARLADAIRQVTREPYGAPQ